MSAAIPWPERPPADLFRAFCPDYMWMYLDRLAMLADTDVRFDESDEYDHDWEMDCQDARDIELLLDLTGCLDAEVGL